MYIDVYTLLSFSYELKVCFLGICYNNVHTTIHNTSYLPLATHMKTCILISVLRLTTFTCQTPSCGVAMGIVYVDCVVKHGGGILK